MDYYRSSALQSLIPDEDVSVKTMDEMLANISPPISNRKINKGDTLSAVAAEYGVSVRELLRLNPQIKNPNLITAGKELSVPVTIKSSLKSDEDYNGKEQDIKASLLGRPGNEEDAIEGAYPEQLLPLMKPLAMLGVNGVTGGIAALARATPSALPRAGSMGNGMVKGAVNWPGAAQSVSNVRPTGNPGMVKAMLVKMQGQQPMASTISPNPVRALNQQGAALNQLGSQLYPGKITPQVANNSLLQALRQGQQKINNHPQEALLQSIMKYTRSEPTLDDLVRVGSKPALSNVPFQELLRRVGYNR